VNLNLGGTQEDDLASRIEKLPNAISAKQLLTLLNISETTLYEMVANGTIPYFRIGTIIRFDPARIADWLRKHEIVPIERRRFAKRAA